MAIALLGLLLLIAFAGSEGLQEVLRLRRRFVLAVDIGCEGFALRLSASGGLDEAGTVRLSALCMSATNAHVCTVCMCNLQFTHWGVFPAFDRVTRIDMAIVGVGVAMRGFRGLRLEKDEAEFFDRDNKIWSRRADARKGTIAVTARS
jgi:hypothetical protein